MIWIIFLLFNSLLALIFLCSRSRHTDEPPLDKGLLPWLGHALEIGKDAAKFLTRMNEKHGDVFTVRLAGRYVTVLLDPNAYNQVLNDAVSLGVPKSHGVLMQKIFSLQLPNRSPADERKLMERHFQDQSLMQLMHRNLQLILSDTSSQTEWTQDGLFSLCYSLLFRAGYLTLFGSEKDRCTSKPAAVYNAFRDFDGLLVKMARSSLKRDEKRRANSSRDRLCELLTPDWLSVGAEPSSWLQSYLCHLQREGVVDTEMQKRALLLQLWATQGNAGPAAFWLLGFLLTHPEAMRAVMEEMACLGPQRHPVAKVEKHSTPVLDSVLSETLRLTAAAFINRAVVGDKALRLSDGRSYLLRRGDTVLLFPFLSPQMDPHIHHQPQEFQFDRFLNADGTERKEFFKGGVRLEHYTMPWGGGDKSCVGKQFAVSSIKQFVFLVLTHLDLELCDHGATMPPVDTSRYGLGMVQPQGDLEIRYRPKRTF